MAATTEVAIIGAGVHGASVGFHLAAMGVKPVIIDRGGAASGTTGRSSAICRAYYTNELLAQVAHDSMEMFRQFDTVTHGRHAGFHPTGMLYLHGPEDAGPLRAAAAMLNHIGTAVDVLDLDQLATDFPHFTRDGLGIAAFERGAGYADPVLTTTGLIERAVDLGATIRLYSAVTAVTRGRNKGATLKFEDGSELEAERVLIAAGPWTRAVVQQLGVDLPLTIERHYVATFRWSNAVPLPYGHGDIVTEYYVKPEGTELFLAGPLHPEPAVNPDRFAHKILDAEIAEMTARIVKRVPSLQAAASTGGWASLYDVSPDWQPVIGEVAPGIFVDAGTSGHGFKLAPALGRHIAGLVMGKVVDRRIEQFSPTRFAAGVSLTAGYGNARILG
jgi:glycine/D-amino acid oxidase-like deaminating enzyme